jgi:hypothetical protein
MIAPSARMMSLGPLYTGGRLRKLRFQMTDNTYSHIGLEAFS